MWSGAEIVAMITLLGILLAFVTTQPAVRASRRSTAEVDPAVLKSHVRRLTAFDRRFYGYPEDLAKAAGYIRDVFHKTSGRVRLEPFRVEGDPYFNVCAAHGPVDGPVLVVGAHYDCVEGSPGADDNASGVAALFELSRVLAGEPPALPVELVAFALEEPPAFATRDMGSMAYAARLKRDGVTVRAMLCLESIGYFADREGSQRYPLPAMRLLYPSRGDFIAIVGRYRDIRLLRQVKGGMRGASDLQVRSFSGPSFIPGVSWSDHVAFWEHGFPAVMITDTALFRNPGYHGEDDTPERLDYARLAKVVLGVECAVRILARR
jgi:hypothetical protein